MLTVAALLSNGQTIMQPTYMIPPLPPAKEAVETLSVYKAHSRALGALSNLRGLAKSIPNQSILIDTIALQEAKASSEIENIVTSQDALYRREIFPEEFVSPEAKEVSLYRDALLLGFRKIESTGGLIPNSVLIDMFRLLMGRSNGFRSTPGTVLKNQATGTVVYVPPQDANEIVKLMTDLERFINDDSLSSLDPLIKMALIHHQFESVHPFPDGNGRIGRILNVLYLARTGLLDIPILYLSRFITRNKKDYYRFLQTVRETGDWESWIIYMLKGVEETSVTAARLIDDIRNLMENVKRRMRVDLPRIYSHDLLNNLFRYPYTRIEFVQRDLELKARQTASRYLDQLAEHGFVVKHRYGKRNYYVNSALLSLIVDASGDDSMT